MNDISEDLLIKSKEDFPYLEFLKINDCYTYQNLEIPLKRKNGFCHLIITGKNGSGKTTVLNCIAQQLTFEKRGDYDNTIKSKNNLITSRYRDKPLERKEQEKQLHELTRTVVSFSNDKKNLQKIDGIFAFFQAYRKTSLTHVSSVTSEDKFVDVLKAKANIGHEDFTKQFKQYLVNKKVYQAFDFMDKKDKEVEKNDLFFENLAKHFRKIFDDKNLELKFVKEGFEFYLQFSDGREVTFNQLSDGFSAFLNIFAHLIMKTDLIRKIRKDYTHDPCGIVLIDEPETHLHIKMQYQILPILVQFFPNIQFIVATHSPAIISSIKNTTIYDLSSQTSIADTVGSSFSELMMSHFQLENEYSPIGNAIIDEVEAIVKKSKDKKSAISQLQDVLEAHKQYLTPTLRLAIESAILKFDDRG